MSLLFQTKILKKLPSLTLLLILNSSLSYSHELELAPKHLNTTCSLEELSENISALQEEKNSYLSPENAKYCLQIAFNSLEMLGAVETVRENIDLIEACTSLSQTFLPGFKAAWYATEFSGHGANLVNYVFELGNMKLFENSFDGRAYYNSLLAFNIMGFGWATHTLTQQYQKVQGEGGLRAIGLYTLFRSTLATWDMLGHIADSYYCGEKIFYPDFDQNQEL